MKGKILLSALFGAFLLCGCKSKTTTKEATTAKPTTVAPSTTKTVTTSATTEEKTLSYNFVIYEKDSDNSDLTDNTVVVSYTISYKASESKTVTDTLIKGEGNKYYFVEGGTDYLILVDSGYGLSYTKGYFKDYSGCASETEIDVDWSYTAVNGSMADKGIGETKLDGLTTYGFVIQGWK